MECKNCYASLQNEDEFCSKCGAKVVKQRLTLKIIFSDFFATFISWDNTLFKTFIQLFKNPEKVINTYINGTRKRLIRPFLYLLIVLSIYGIYLFLIQDLMLEAITNKFSTSNDELKLDDDFIQKMKGYSVIFSKYFNIFTMLLIPLYAFLSKVIFRKHKYNFVEHIVIQTYIQAQVLITGVILISILILLTVDVLVASNIIVPFMYVYYIYVFKKVFNISYAETLLKFLLLILFFIIIVVLISIIGGLIYAITLKLQNGM